MTVIYYAIQLPCDPQFDFNYGFYSVDELIETMNFNYGKRFHIESKEIRGCDTPVRYVVSSDGETYARIVEIYVQ